jgi:hypothetical protein
MKLISTIALALTITLLAGSASAKDATKKPAKKADAHEVIVNRSADVGQLQGRTASTPAAPSDVTLATR